MKSSAALIVMTILQEQQPLASVSRYLPTVSQLCHAGVQAARCDLEPPWRDTGGVIEAPPHQVE